MATLFLDSSAVVKRYVVEPGSAWIANQMDPTSANALFVAVVAGAEVVAAIARRRNRGALNAAEASRAIAEFADDWVRALDLVNVNRASVDRAMDLAQKHGLRGYDSIQLSAALELNAISTEFETSVLFVSADDELNIAAGKEGLTVENPNLHP